MFVFEIIKKSKKSKARIGKITTPHGEILTPAFIPVATLGVIKGALDMQDVEKAKVQCAIMNTFHFWDSDASAIVKRAGGLHAFTKFQKPIFTDSGGFQVFSLGKGAEYGLGKVGSIFPHERGLPLTKRELIPAQKNKMSIPYSREWWNNAKHVKTRSGLVKKISEEGVRFLSPRDGRELLLTPEKSAEIQIGLGADFIYLLDICGSALDNHTVAKAELERTNRWYKRFFHYREYSRMQSHKLKRLQEVFGIIQGGPYKDLRMASTETVNSLPVFGIAIGGALGKDRREMLKIISWINQKIDWQRLHHLLGIGDSQSIPQIIKSGIDLFDCAMPTRIARHGTALTKAGYLDIRKNILRNSFKPIDKNCHCFTCQNYYLAQLNFLARSGETLAGRLLTIHNLSFLESYLERIRNKIAMNKF